ncbi:MAG: oxidoreductase [Aeromicrobium sp.]
MSRTWLVTGGSSGFGRALADEIVRRGDRVAVTARDASRLADVPDGASSLGLVLDLTDESTFDPALDRLDRAFGPVDVLINNAGYGLLGAIEETSQAELRDQLETNFFGPATLTSRLLPGLRERGSGAVVNVSSVSGVRGAPGSGYYAASKFALEGWSDSLRFELAPFGVHVMVVEPGSFRTDFFGRSRRHTASELGLYDAVDARRRSVAESPGHQPGDPQKGARAVLAALAAPEPPARLVLGAAAVDMVAMTLAARADEVERWRDLSASVDHEPGT